MRNKVLAAILAFIGGSIGLHKFYLRERGAGIFYIFLMLMTAEFFPVSVLLGFIDGMRYLMMPEAEFDRKFNKKYKRTSSRPNHRKRRERESYKERRPSSSRSRKERKSAPRVRNNPFKKSGLKKYKEYEIEEAIEDFKKGLKIQPNDIALHFNLACAYSLLENKKEAFKHLSYAIDNGLKDTKKIMSHDDLAFLRIQPEFDKVKANGFRIEDKTTKKTEKNTQQIPSPQGRPMDDLLLAQLNRLMELRKKGVLTEQEFVRERKKILVR